MSNLTEFLRTKQQQERAEGSSLEKRKEEWLGSLTKLFIQIKTWLAEPVSQDLIEITEESFELDEYKIGSYKAPRLVLHAGHDSVSIEPVGTIIMGAKGRVDVKASGNSFKIILTDKNEWGILQPDRTIATRLDEHTFTEALQNLLS